MKESTAFKVMELSKSNHILHDDRLLIRAHKHKIKLEADWRKYTLPSYENGKAIVTGYYDRMKPVNERTYKDYISIEKYNSLPYEEQWYFGECQQKGIHIAEGVNVTFLNDQVDLRICSLYGDWRSRYRIALEGFADIVKRGIITYKPYKQPTEETAEKNLTEAIRHRLKQYGKPAEYEYNILFTGEIGKLLYEALKPFAEKIEENTTYLQGYNKHKKREIKVKMYDIGVRDQAEAGKGYKLEITLYGLYFKKNQISVEKLTEQPEIQVLIQDKIISTLSKYLNKLEGAIMGAMANQLQIPLTENKRTRGREFASALIKKEYTLTERVEALERNMARVDTLEREVAEIKKAVFKR